MISKGRNQIDRRRLRTRIEPKRSRHRETRRNEITIEQDVEEKRCYEKNEEDPDILNPIPFELEAIEMARKYVKQYSFRQVANWVTQKTGREISHVGLRKRLMHEQQRKNKARTLKRWSEYAQKAIEKAKAIEESRIGAKA